MRWYGSSAAIALLCSSLGADAAALFPRAVSGKGYLSVPVGTVDRPKRNDNVTKRAENAFVQTLKNKDFFYAADVAIGTPPQTVTVLVDTGSSELWVNPDCRTAPSEMQYKQCISFGEYDPAGSKTPPIGPFGEEQINYGDASDASTQTSVDIEYFTDTISFGGAKIQNQTFGVVTSSKGQSQGIMGLAPDLRGGFSDNQPYSLVLNSMYEQGVISSRLFSLDLRHSQVQTGAVVYGGVDKNKFIGKFESVPIIRGERGEFRLAVRMSSTGITLGSKNQEFQVSSDDTNVMLDSGTTVSRLHFNAARPILQALNAQDDGEGYYVANCSLRQRAGSIDFGFGEKIIRVPFSDFLIDVGSSQYCYIGVVVTTDQQILGDTVLRAGYFVFDWDNKAVHIAQAANCGKDDIEAVGGSNKNPADVQGNCQDSDAIFTGGPASVTRTATLPTQAYTTTYTITSCPVFELSCKTGVVTTQTIGASAATATSDSGDGDDSAGTQIPALTWIWATVGIFAFAYNLL